MRRIKYFYSRQFVYLVAGVFIILLAIVVSYSVPPRDFPQREIVKIKEGQSLTTIANNLAEKYIIKSPFLFRVYITLLSGSRSIKASSYLFDEPQSALRIAHRLKNGVLGMPLIKVTINEGLTAKDIGAVIKRSIPAFDAQSFLVVAKPYEGYLFPETYYFYESVGPEDVVAKMRETFTEKIKTQLLAIQASGRKLEDIVNMASIVEKEATGTEDRKLIAGVLWKRIEIGMPLQVDPPFYYSLNKISTALTLDDLATNTPYNTYKNLGLPPTPICNPGLDSILATINPEKSKYLFFLADKKGNIHYAVDHEGHVVNKNKYLR